jgi:hypothetical protein
MASTDFTIEDLHRALEPSVAADFAITEAAALTSIAISLKRIADALYEGDDQHSGVIQQLSRLEYNTRETV